MSKLVFPGERLTDAETDAIMTDTETQPDLEGNLKYEGIFCKVFTIFCLKTCKS